jgi:hypothetical protein
MITYDLNDPGQRYAKLAEAIKALSRNGSWWHYLDSTWVVPSNLTCGQVTDHLKPYLDGNDEILVLDITNDSYQGLFSEEAWKVFNAIMQAG